jgi:predicted transcriptional regulator
MKQEAIKLELIEWLAKLNDSDTIKYLKKIKDARTKQQDWWKDLPEQQKNGILRGLKDIEEGRTVPHEEIKAKYGL